MQIGTGGRGGQRTRVVIAGMGDTGVLIAVRLSRRFAVTGVSTRPSLVSGQELGNRLVDPEGWRHVYQIPFRRFRRLDGVDQVHGRIVGIDPDGREVAVEAATGATLVVPYDVLVIATGVTNGFWRTNTVEDDAAVDARIATVVDDLAAAQTVAVVGGGATGVSVAANLATAHPDTEVHLFHSGAEPLPGYHPRARTNVAAEVRAMGVHVHPGHRAVVPDGAEDGLGVGPVTWSTGQDPFDADRVVWALGRVRPHNEALPPNMLDADGFVRVDEYLRVVGHDDVFAVGDIAASDPHRSSARNWGYVLVAHNIRVSVAGRTRLLKRYSAPAHRWGSVLGVQADGLRIHQPSGRSFRVPAALAGPLLVRGWIERVLYKGLRR